MVESVRTRVKQLTKTQISAMSDADVDALQAKILSIVEEEKKAGRTKDLAYLYKALPGDRKTDEMKKRILPFNMNDYKKSVPKPKKNKKPKNKSSK